MPEDVWTCSPPLQNLSYGLWINPGFLGNASDPKLRKRLITAFEELEDMLGKAKLEGKGMVQKMFMSKGWEKDKDSHLLSYTLSRFEREAAGFNTIATDSTQPRSSERARLYLSFVRPDRFRQLTTGYHWKDPTVSPDHGEFTHRLQWYALVAAGVLTQDDAKAVMQKCGTYVCTKPPANKKGVKVPETDLWEVLFDRDQTDSPNSNFLYPTADSDLDFRNPNNLNLFLMGSKNLKFLSSFLTARYQKRKSMSGEEYVAKKRFGKELANLNETERIKLYGIVLDGQAGGNQALYATQIAMAVYGDVDDDKLEIVRNVISEEYPLPYM